MSTSLYSQSKFIIATIFLMGLFLANLALSQTVMNLNLAIREAQQQLEISQNQTRELKVRAARYTSSAYLLKQAKKLGFIETTEVVYLPSFEILAKND